MEKRRLAAIMFTDIVGFTTMMGTDEDKTMSLIRRNKDIHKKLLRKYNGKWLKDMGDGTLASFTSAIDAVYCAADIINQCKELNIDLRIGIHLGDIIEEKGDVFGEGVNLASRLETVAEPGGIYVSEPVYRNVRNKDGVSSEYLGERVLKNVEEPVKIFNIRVDISRRPISEEKPRGISVKIMLASTVIAVIIIIVYMLINHFGSEKERVKSHHGLSIAVMPFVDMSPDQDQAYLGDGIAEEIINQLTRIPALKVIGRTSSFSLRNKEIDIKTIGELLGAETILEGSVQRAGNTLRITAQLISAKDGFHLWSERYDREMKDIFKIQDELASLVADKVKPGIRTSTDRSGSNVNKTNPLAYEFFLKGKYVHQNKFEISFTLEDFKTSEALFLRAIDIDPNFALPHAGLADIYHSYQVSFAPFDDNPEKQKYVQLQKKHIRIAYLLDPQSDYVNLIKGWIYNSLRQYDSAYYHIKQSIILNPGTARNYVGLGLFLFYRGLNYESSILFNKSREIDPLDMAAFDIQAQNEYAFGHDKKALDILNEVLLLNPDSHNALFYKVVILLVNGRINEAQATYEVLLEKIPDEDHAFLRGALYAAGGDSISAFNTFNGGLFYYRMLGNKEAFIKALPDFLMEEDNDHKSFYIPMMQCQYYRWIRNDPGFNLLVDEEKIEYDRLKARYGNLEFIDP